MSVLVTGGAGYIGAHVVRVLRAAGRDVVVVDDLSTGDAQRVDGSPLVRLDVAETAAVPVLARTMRAHRVDAVVHLAGRKRVDESLARPEHYYRQNVGGLAHVLAAARDAGVGRFVFSSSAAVYGPTTDDRVDEDARTAPASPYGETKLAGEWLVRAAARACGTRAVSLRYFNVAGAGWPELGDPSVQNLVTRALERLTRGERPELFGTDYATPDGTCVRDFVHVLDLAEAHVAALDDLAGPGPVDRVLNVGTGSGASVRDVLDGLRRVTGVALEPVVRGRRAGDPPSVVAAVGRIEAELGWRARTDLDDILASSWDAWQASAGRPLHRSRSAAP